MAMPFVCAQLTAEAKSGTDVDESFELPTTNVRCRLSALAGCKITPSAAQLLALSGPRPPDSLPGRVCLADRFFAVESKQRAR